MMVVFSYLNHGHGHLDHLPVEVFSVKPLNGRLGSIGIIVGHGGFSFRQSSVVIFVDKDPLVAGFPVILNDSDGTKELGNILGCCISWKSLDKDLVV